MGNKPEPEDAMITCDDIGDLARVYMMEPGLRGLAQIDEQIDRAKGDSRWDDMSKWHRVRFRMIRLSRAGH
jgi:hypothetical protein